MAMSKFKVGLGILVVAGAAIMIFLQYRTQQQLQSENDSLHQQIEQLKAGNQDTPIAANSANSDELNELLHLRGEVGALRAQTNQIARLQQQNQQLREAVTNLAQRKQEAQQASDPTEEQQRAFAILQMNYSRQAVLGMMMYAQDNQDQFPTNFDQAAPYYGDRNSAIATNLNQFEIVYHGALGNLANPASTIVVKSVQPWMAKGKWAKAYGFADGHSEVHSEPNGNFDEWEQQHVPVFKGQ